AGLSVRHYLLGGSVSGVLHSGPCFLVALTQVEELLLELNALSGEVFGATEGGRIAAHDHLERGVWPLRDRYGLLGRLSVSHLPAHLPRLGGYGFGRGDRRRHDSE